MHGQLNVEISGRQVVVERYTPYGNWVCVCVVTYPEARRMLKDAWESTTPLVYRLRAICQGVEFTARDDDLVLAAMRHSCYPSQVSLGHLAEYVQTYSR